MMMKRYSEDELISKLFSPIAGPEALGLGDDAALMAIRDKPLVLTTDMLVAGVHFFNQDPPELIAKKALRVNLSDLAAKGAVPQGFLLSIALPGDWSNVWLESFARGLSEDALDFATPLLGGDTSSTSGPVTISITAIGTVETFVARCGARVGDGVYVSGPIGEAALGLWLRENPGRLETLPLEARDGLLGRYLLPRPRLDLIPMLASAATASMDISDGLVGDLAKLMGVSGVSAEVRLSDIPLSLATLQAIALSPELLEIALTGGDDYEILFTAGGDFSPPKGIRRIGWVTAGSNPPKLCDGEGKSVIFKKDSYRHF
ncbi:MAG: thiamine-phosphate kinase [Methylocystis sp.]